MTRFNDNGSEQLYAMVPDKTVLDRAGFMVVGLRNSYESSRFDDLIGLVARYQGVWYGRLFAATTEPGEPMLLNPMNRKGAAILPDGHYRDLWKFGKHKGKYPALVQNVPVALWRDFDRDGLAEPGNLDAPQTVGINLHRASANWTETNHRLLSTQRVPGKWSAGCQVVASATHFRYLMWFFSKCAKKGTADYLLLDNTGGLYAPLKILDNGSFVPHNHA